MKILLLIPFILYITISASENHCPTSYKLPPTPYGPAYINVNNIPLAELRNKLNRSAHTEYQTLLESNKNITCLEIMPEDISDYRRCFQYALETITGFNGFIQFPHNNNFSIDLEKYFQQTPYAKKNDLMIYTTNQINREICHFAVAIDQVWSQSKSGSHPQICKHLPSDLPRSYGKAVWSFELKHKYQGDEGAKLLIQDIQLDLYNQMKFIADHIKFQHHTIKLQNQQIYNLQNQDKSNKVNYFCLGAVAGITYMICIVFLNQKYKNTLS